MVPQLFLLGVIYLAHSVGLLSAFQPFVFVSSSRIQRHEAQKGQIVSTGSNNAAKKPLVGSRHGGHYGSIASSTRRCVMLQVRETMQNESSLFERVESLPSAESIARDDDVDDDDDTPTTTFSSSYVVIMTSGAFTAAYLELIPEIESLTQKEAITAATSIGTGSMSIPNRLARGERADVVIVADSVLQGLIRDGLVWADSYTPLVRSSIGMVMQVETASEEDVDDGASCNNSPDVTPVCTVDDVTQALLRANSIAYSASVSGQHVTGEMYQRLGIANQVMDKSVQIGGGERVAAVVARGEADIGFQQMSELLPFQGLAVEHNSSTSSGTSRNREEENTTTTTTTACLHIVQLPPELQKVSVFSAGVAKISPNPALAQSVIDFLASSSLAAVAINKSGLEQIRTTTGTLKH